LLVRNYNNNFSNPKKQPLAIFQPKTQSTAEVVQQQQQQLLTKDTNQRRRKTSKFVCGCFFFQRAKPLCSSKTKIAITAEPLPLILQPATTNQKTGFST
jgi:hypothetical protein